MNRTGHTFADEDAAEYNRELYYRTQTGVVQARCLYCQEWLPLVEESEPCVYGVTLTVGLKYDVMLAGDPIVYKAMLVQEIDDADPMTVAWFVYDCPAGQGNKVSASKYVRVLTVDTEHAFGLWDKIADTLPAPDEPRREVAIVQPPAFVEIDHQTRNALAAHRGSR